MSERRLKDLGLTIPCRALHCKIDWMPIGSSLIVTCSGPSDRLVLKRVSSYEVHFVATLMNINVRVAFEEVEITSHTNRPQELNNILEETSLLARPIVLAS